MKKKKWQLKMTRRQVLKAGMIGGAGLMLPLRFLPAKAFAEVAQGGLSNPADQPMFFEPVPDALSDGFKYSTFSEKGKNVYRVGAGYNADHETGLIYESNRVPTPIYGYGQVPTVPTDTIGYSWPGRTFEVQAGRRTVVQWSNNLPEGEHLLPVDTTLHWCYSLHGYEDYSIATNGVPTVMHLHGGHTKDLFDGNPEQFFSPGYDVRGPRFQSRSYVYDNDRPAGNLWYHDHALGITRLNVYAGLAGFYFVRDENDTGRPLNPLKLPASPYEKAYAIQDRMFRETGELFYPAFKGDFRYDEFIDTLLPDPPFSDREGPTALAEFFGDHMVVNGKIWPREDVEPRPYRLHLLNGCDSRFMAIRFRGAGNAANKRTTIPVDGAYVPFYVIGSDQGLASSISVIKDGNYLVFEPGSRYDIIVDFTNYADKRIIMENIGGDDPFGGDVPGEFTFNETNRIMAFDVIHEVGHFDGGETAPVHPTQADISFGPDVPMTATRTRKVALFEGKDEFGRLQPLLGTAEPTTDFGGRKPINWPATPVYQQAKLPNGDLSSLTGPMEGSIAWHSPTTENPALNSTEEWEIWNVTGDAHPVHLHLVHFEVLGRQVINFDSGADDDGFLTNGAADDGVYMVQQPTVQHNSVAGDASTYGIGFRIVHPSNPEKAYGADVALTSADGYVENAPKDMVTALPGQITRIKATFDKPGRYVWHCHILSHEDHEMMRVLHVGGGDKDSHP